MVAALKFFLGQDEAAENDSDDDDDEDEFKAVQPTKAEVYKANSKVHYTIVSPYVIRQTQYMIRNTYNDYTHLVSTTWMNAGTKCTVACPFASRLICHVCLSVFDKSMPQVCMLSSACTR